MRLTSALCDAANLLQNLDKFSMRFFLLLLLHFSNRSSSCVCIARSSKCEDHMPHNTRRGIELAFCFCNFQEQELQWFWHILEVFISVFMLAFLSFVFCAVYFSFVWWSFYTGGNGFLRLHCSFFSMWRSNAANTRREIEWTFCLCSFQKLLVRRNSDSPHSWRLSRLYF